MSNHPTSKNPAVPNNTVHMEAIRILTARPSCMHLLPIQAIAGGKATIRFETEEAVIERLLPAKVIAGMKDEASKAVAKYGNGAGVYFLKDSVGADVRTCLAIYCPAAASRYTSILFQCPYSSLNGKDEQLLLEKWAVVTGNILTAMGIDPAGVIEDMPGVVATA